ncbi:Zinc finger CCCH domain-containing protein 45 [Cardamine amara subsp. amara]|uniref:Zinc finger CCCH domain-containing protein 45 n=1 Tax=Cardamine amara subsp. amara TaxID=228776 RepID=A0ABD1A0W7_CARAN
MKRPEKMKFKVSWAQDLCQVKLFQKEDCPSQVGPPLQFRNFSKTSSRKPEEPDLPPGFEKYYAAKQNVSNIPQIKWKRPQLKFSFSPTWRVEAGGESTEIETQHLRNSKVLEAFYPYPSAIPSQPAVSQVVEAEHFDDSKTPVIPLTAIEDKLESSHSTVESGFSALKLVSSLAPILSTLDKEYGSMVDTDLLVKILSDPEMVKKLLTGTTGEIQPSTNVEQSIVASQQPFTNPEQRRVSPPMPGNGNISSLRPINQQPLPAGLPSSSCVGIAKEQPLSAWLPSRSLPANLSLHRPDQVVTGLVQPMTTKKDHVRRLIREHGKETHGETNQNRLEAGIVDRRNNGSKVRKQKQCIYFDTARGCRNGDGCLFVHDRVRSNTGAEAPTAKKMKFGRYK